MSFSEYSRADEIEQARHRRFDTLVLDHVDAAAMPDPQRGLADSNLVVPGASPLRATVEAMKFPAMQRTPSGAGGPGLPRNANEAAQGVVAEARATARDMLAQAREAIAAERAAAVQQGHAEGYAAGMAEADAETAGLIATCDRIGQHVAQERSRVLEEHEADVVELAMAIARRVVNAAIDVDEQLVVEACRGAMRKAFQRGSMQVLAHPGDLALLREAGPQLAAELGGVHHLDFVEERRLDRGSVIVRTPAGEIDATIDGKAAKIEQALREGVEQRRAERRAAV